MELKKYQKQVLCDLSNYLRILNENKNIKTAYKEHWESKDIRIGMDGMQEYKDTITGTPHVCFKVPTGGGKTYIACAALKPFFEQMPLSKTKVVAWLVPSNAILEQTIRTLSDVDHPYRERIDMDFGGRLSPVVIVDESHNAQSDLSIEMLNNLNPSFILDLTATPKANSNIISFVKVSK